MRRFHLFEWEDQPWLPRVFRDFITDHLRYTQTEPMRRPVNLAIAERLKEAIARTRSPRVVDLCAGAGGPLICISQIWAETSSPVDIVLTDLYPNVDAFRRIEAESHGVISARYESTSALDVPPDLSGIRTLFTALHHFKPEQVRAIFADAVRKRAAIAVFEPLERTVRMLIVVGVMSLLRGWTHTPRVGEVTLQRFLFTYLIPVAPVLLAWDGMVSVLRSYTPSELLALAQDVEGDSYWWESGSPHFPGPLGSMPMTFLVGGPKADLVTGPWASQFESTQNLV